MKYDNGSPVLFSLHVTYNIEMDEEEMVLSIAFHNERISLTSSFLGHKIRILYDFIRKKTDCLKAFSHYEITSMGHLHMVFPSSATGVFDFYDFCQTLGFSKEAKKLMDLLESRSNLTEKT